MARRTRVRSSVVSKVALVAGLVLLTGGSAAGAQDVESIAGDDVTIVAAQASPTITVEPSTGLTAGQTVTVTGSGFTPNKAIGVSMCDDPFVDGSSCDFSTAEIGNSDANGAFTMAYTVVDEINGHTCVPTGCLIGSSNLNVQNEFANRVSVTFAEEPATTSTTAGSPSTTVAGGAGSSTSTTAPAPSRPPSVAGGRLANTGPSNNLAPLVGGAACLLLVGAAIVKRARVSRSG